MATEKENRVSSLPAALLSLAEKKAKVTLAAVQKDPTVEGAIDLTIALAWVVEKTDNGYTGTYEEYGMAHNMDYIAKVLEPDEDE